MQTKNMTKQDAIKALQKITLLIKVNNDLRKAIRKEIETNPEILLVVDETTGKTRQINGWHDSATQEMRTFIENFFKTYSQEVEEKIKNDYIYQAAAIFSNPYSIASNVSLLRDKKDLLNYLEMLDNNELLDNAKDNESIEGATITRENGRLNIDFGGRVDKEVYKILRSNGFLYSPKYEQFTRQLTPNAEASLKRVIEKIKTLATA